jgi:hypothetical protein
MSADPDPALLAAALVFAGAAIAGSAVAIRDGLPGQPCGISVPLTVPAGLLAGWGAGVAAPWPMPVTAVIAAARSQRTRPTALTGAVCAGIGVGCVLQILVFWHRDGMWVRGAGRLPHSPGRAWTGSRTARPGRPRIGARRPPEYEQSYRR